MLFTAQYLAVLASIPILTSGLPLDAKPQHIVPRQKSYAVINVDGGSTAEATTTIKATKTIEVVNPGPTITQEVTTTVATPDPAPTPTSPSSKSASSASSHTPSISSSPSLSVSIPAETPKPIFITVTVGKDQGPTQYYDNGLWHTYYPVKSFADAVVISTSTGAAPNSTSLPA